MTQGRIGFLSFGIALGIPLALLTIAGCSHLGPASIARDRMDYTTAIGDSWKSQMLLNIVRIRYGDAPIFMEVASIINQYSAEGGLSASLGWSAPPSANSQSLGGSASYYDRPTVTYNLLSGEKFARGLMAPLAPATLMSLVEGGYPIDIALRLGVHSINGINNEFGGFARQRQADPEFATLAERLRLLQSSGAVTMRVRHVDGKEALVMIFRQHADAQTGQAGREVRRMLGLREGATELRVVYGAGAHASDEIALQTRSLYEILSDIAGNVEVPPEDIAEQRVDATMEHGAEGPMAPLVRIRASAGKPADAFAAVPYRNRWFWIDDRDLPSKKLFSFLMFVMTLSETGDRAGTPIVTVSAGG